MTDGYLRAHLQKAGYRAEKAGACRHYRHARGWRDSVIGKSMIFSHRDTVYESKESFTEGLHSHQYYEVLFYLSGDVEYIKENTLIKPRQGSVIWFKPGEIHTARLVKPSRYERYVMYFSPSFFRLDGRTVPMTDFMERSEVLALNPNERSAAEILSLIQKAEDYANGDKPFGALMAKSCITEIFGALSAEDLEAADGYRMNDSMSEVKRYIDEEYASIHSIGEIADRFFYSREHLSRKFKSRFNVSVYDYLTQRRITESLPMLMTVSVAEASYAVGFHSQSAYIGAFVKHIGCLPSEYKKRNSR